MYDLLDLKEHPILSEYDDGNLQIHINEFLEVYGIDKDGRLWYKQMDEGWELSEDKIYLDSFTDCISVKNFRLFIVNGKLESAYLFNNGKANKIL